MRKFNLVSLAAVVTSIFGFALAGWGPMMLSSYGATQIPSPVADDAYAMSYWSGVAFVRLCGAVLTAFGLLIWSVRKVIITEAGRGIILAVSIGSGFAFLISCSQQTAIWGTTAGRVTVLWFLMLTLGFGYVWIERGKAENKMRE
ncbi:MAG TPA: hypothetical protein VF762_01335 [Blastocatellia bacterium]